MGSGGLGAFSRVAMKSVFVKHSQVLGWNANSLEEAVVWVLAVFIGERGRNVHNATRCDCVVSYNASLLSQCGLLLAMVEEGSVVKIDSEVKVYCARHNVGQGEK